jgi:hypothetical protein
VKKCKKNTSQLPKEKWPCAIQVPNRWRSEEKIVLDMDFASEFRGAK